MEILRLTEFEQQLESIDSTIFLDWAQSFAVGDSDPWKDGSFSYHRGAKDWDIFGLLDMLLAAEVLEPILHLSQRMDVQIWATKILSCFDERGLLSNRNPTYHVIEHVTAYAYTGLLILARKGAQFELPPFNYFTTPTKENEFKQWFNNMGFRIPRWYAGEGLKGSLKRSAKQLGWNHFWPGSHVGGGIAAIYATRQVLQSDLKWEEVRKNPCQELKWFINLANQSVEKETGLWRPWFKRWISRYPKIGDYGGAAHFYWIYAILGEKLCNPKHILRNGLRLQKQDGMYLHRPFCIDLDFTQAFYYASASIEDKMLHIAVANSMIQNGLAVLSYLTDKTKLMSYSDTHALPGALCSLAMCESYLRSNGQRQIRKTQDPFKYICWI